MRNSTRILFACLTALAVEIAPDASRADFIVTGANYDNVKAGDALLSGATVTLKKGHWLRLINRDTGQTSMMNGPYEGRIQDYKSECSVLSRIGGGCAAGAPDPRVPIGGTRDVR